MFIMSTAAFVKVVILIEIDFNKIAKIASEMIKFYSLSNSLIMKYKTLDKENAQIENVLNNLIANLNFENQEQLQEYFKNFNISIDDLREKIEIENEWKSLVYAKYFSSVKIDKLELQKKIENMSKKEF